MAKEFETAITECPRCESDVSYINTIIGPRWSCTKCWWLYQPGDPNSTLAGIPPYGWKGDK